MPFRCILVLHKTYYTTKISTEIYVQHNISCIFMFDHSSPDCNMWRKMVLDTKYFFLLQHFWETILLHLFTATHLQPLTHYNSLDCAVYLVQLKWKAGSAKHSRHHKIMTLQKDRLSNSNLKKFQIYLSKIMTCTTGLTIHTKGQKRASKVIHS